MRNIRLMSRELAEKIAAGEVVERPGSIVKELCENSIDAGSTAITVEIRDGGISYIRITDNGSGIQAQEVELAFKRHSTSKMYDQEELFNITSLGFRGEALASIAAVSQLKMTTRVKAANTGMLAELSGGEMLSLHETGCPFGTSITVCDLFFNTPVRRKFLKKPAQEAAFIGDIVSRLILSYPAISFKFVQDGRTILHSPGDNLLKDAVMAVYGRAVCDNMLPVDFTRDGIRVYGHIGNSELEKSNKSYQSLFVNGRYIKDQMASAAVQSGYVNNITIGKFPMFILFLQVPCSLVDVNVHPNKLEVRFSDELLVSNIITAAVQAALSVKNEIPELHEKTKSDPQESGYTVIKDEMPVTGALAEGDGRASEYLNKEQAGLSGVSQPADDKQPESDCLYTEAERMNITAALKPMNFSKGTAAAEGVYPALSHMTDRPQPVIQMSFADSSPEKRDIFLEYRLIGQIFNTYVVVQSGDVVYLIDQHAAHERLLYERLVKSMQSGEPMRQTLLSPQVLQLNFSERARLIDMIADLEAMGFELEEFGETEYLIRSVPVLMDKPCGAELIYSILSNDALKACRSVDIKREKLMQTACKHAVKGGEMLLQEELAAIMEFIRMENVPLTCPHGRPILVCLTKKELELRFKRIQS